MGANTGPGWKKYPKHRITTKPAGVRVQIKFKGEVIADTRDAIQLEETHVGHVVAPVVYYIPRKDVKMERLARTEHHTDCRSKGRLRTTRSRMARRTRCGPTSSRTTRCSRSRSCSPSIPTSSTSGSYRSAPS